MAKNQQQYASTQIKWAEKIAQTSSERLAIYVNSALREPPAQYRKEVRLYWLTAIALNTISIILISFSLYIPTNKNLNNDVKLIRVDGKIINEAQDQRRDVYINNIIRRVEMMKEVEQK